MWSPLRRCSFLCTIHTSFVVGHIRTSVPLLPFVCFASHCSFQQGHLMLYALLTE